MINSFHTGPIEPAGWAQNRLFINLHGPGLNSSDKEKHDRIPKKEASPCLYIDFSGSWPIKFTKEDLLPRP